ncbi:hypothetical protein L1887_55060 [Cichorium endivia]|nr:hypothetical protein L1887_55060 [Cichorium endivia]
MLAKTSHDPTPRAGCCSRAMRAHQQALYHPLPALWSSVPNRSAPLARTAMLSTAAWTICAPRPDFLTAPAPMLSSTGPSSRECCVHAGAPRQSHANPRCALPPRGMPRRHGRSASGQAQVHRSEWERRADQRCFESGCAAHTSSSSLTRSSSNKATKLWLMIGATRGWKEKKIEMAKRAREQLASL